MTTDTYTPSDAERERAAAHVEFARHEAAKIPDIPADLPTRPVGRVAVIGAGTMGGGIAMSLANIGIPATVIDADPAALDRGLGRVRANYASSVSRGRLAQTAMDERLGLIRGSVDIADVKDADMVIEAVFEDLALKQRIFRQLDAIAKPGAILATNTSGLDVDAIAAATQRPQDVVGAHFFSPAHVMKLLEVVRADKTAPDVIATLMDLGRRMGKVAVLSRIYPGFIGNALFRNYTREAHFLVEDGALPHEVDAALTRFGYAMGIFAVHDLAGNDVGHQTRKAQMATRPTDRRWNDLIMKLVDQGRLGQKSGSGWYRYDEGSRKPQRDPEVEKFIIEESQRMGITRRPIDRRRDHQALRLRHGQRRRETSRAGHRPAPERYRHRLRHRLWLSSAPWRTDVLRGPHRACQRACRYQALPCGVRFLVGTRAAARAPGARWWPICRLASGGGSMNCSSTATATRRSTRSHSCT